MFEKYILFLELQAVSDADGCNSKYCPSVAGPRITQHLAEYWFKKNGELSRI
jgi:hypothetical protein